MLHSYVIQRDMSHHDVKRKTSVPLALYLFTSLDYTVELQNEFLLDINLPLRSINSFAGMNFLHR